MDRVGADFHRCLEMLRSRLGAHADAVIGYLPSPLDIPPVQGINPETRETEERKAADDAPFSALAFKIMNDQHVGQLVFLRVYSGALAASSGVLNSTKDKKERVGRLL